jgi:hypothetical protein
VDSLKKHRYLVLLIGLFLIVLQGEAYSQKAKLELKSDSIALGAQTQLAVTIEYPIDQGTFDIQWPLLSDSIPQGIEIVRKSRIDTALVDGEDPYVFYQKIELTITSFDSGFVVIEPLLFLVNGDSIFTNAALLEVVWPEIDETGSLKDIKDISLVQYTFWDWIKDNLLFLGIVIAVIAILVLAIFFFKKRKNKTSVQTSQPEIQEPADIVALRQLGQLKEKKLWQAGHVKTYHSELTEILRMYLERRFNIHALEQTSLEIISDVNSILQNDEAKQNLTKTLEIADSVKFAKHKSGALENEQSLKMAIQFIESTRKPQEHV